MIDSLYSSSSSFPRETTRSLRSETQGIVPCHPSFASMAKTGSGWIRQVPGWEPALNMETKVSFTRYRLRPWETISSSSDAHKVDVDVMSGLLCDVLLKSMTSMLDWFDASVVTESRHYAVFRVISERLARMFFSLSGAGYPGMFHAEHNANLPRLLAQSVTLLDGLLQGKPGCFARVTRPKQ